MVDTPLMIATCKYHMKELDQAEKDLLQIVEQQSSSDRDAIRNYQVADILSRICFIRNQLEAAESHCRKALKG